MELLTSDGISHITSVVGYPLYMDKATEHRYRIQFARVCVEVGHEDEYPYSNIVEIESVGEIVVHVEYPWKPKACSVCGRFGHGDLSCTSVKKV